MKKLAFLLLMSVIFACGAYADESIDEGAKEKVISEIGVLVNAQKYQTALTKCEKALKKYPDEAFLYYWKGTILSSLDDKKSALENYNKSIELNPENAKTYVMRGSCKSDLEDKEGALADFNKAIELDPKNGAAYSLRALVKLDLGDFTGANEDLDSGNKLMNSKDE